MKKGYGSYIGILLLASALLNGCSHSTQVTNTPTTTSSTWAGVTQDPMYPVVISDSLGETLTAVRDTTSNKIIAEIFRDSKNDSAVIWLSDSVLPSKAVFGKCEFFFSNYTDSSVDIAITDTAGDIGVLQKLNIADVLHTDTIRSNVIKRASLKNRVVPLDATISGLEFWDILNMMVTGYSSFNCVVGLATLGSVIFLSGGTALAGLSTVIPEVYELGLSCWEAFQSALEFIRDHGLPSTPPAAPSPYQKPGMNNGAPLAAGNSLDQYINSMPSSTSIAWSNANSGTITTSGAVQGSGGTSDGISSFSGSAGSDSTTAYVTISNGILSGGGNSPVKDGSSIVNLNFLITDFPCKLGIFSDSKLIYGTFSASGTFSENPTGWLGPGTISGSFKINK